MQSSPRSLMSDVLVSIAVNFFTAIALNLFNILVLELSQNLYIFLMLLGLEASILLVWLVQTSTQKSA